MKYSNAEIRIILMHFVLYLANKVFQAPFCLTIACTPVVLLSHMYLVITRISPWGWLPQGVVFGFQVGPMLAEVS